MGTTSFAFLVGRLLFGGFFLFSSVGHFTNLAELSSAAAAQGVPFPEFAVLFTGVLLVVGGASVLLGAFPRVGLAALAVFFIGVTPVMHAFWTIDDPAMRAAQFASLLRNLALLGATLALFAVPTPWPFSLSRARGRRTGAAVRGRHV